MTDIVENLLKTADLAFEESQNEIDHMRDILLASAPTVEITEEIDELKWAAIEVLLNSNLTVEDIITAAELIGIEGPEIVRDMKGSES